MNGTAITEIRGTEAAKPDRTEQVHPEYLGRLREVVGAYKSGLFADPTRAQELSLARMLSVAPQSYFDGLEALKAGAEVEWRNWARDYLERHDHPQFFEALRQIREAVDLHGHEGVHCNPQYVGLFIQAFEAAPPRYRAEAEAILAPAVPTATHVNADGEPVFSASQIAGKLGVAVDEVQAFIDEHIDPSRLYTGIAHPIQ